MKLQRNIRGQIKKGFKSLVKKFNVKWGNSERLVLEQWYYQICVFKYFDHSLKMSP